MKLLRHSLKETAGEAIMGNKLDHTAFIKVLLAVFLPVLALPHSGQQPTDDCVRTFIGVKGPFAFKSLFISEKGDRFTVGARGEISVTTANRQRTTRVAGNVDLRSSYFFSETTGYVVGVDGWISSTEDNGKTWIFHKSNSTRALNSIVCKQRSRCWAAGDSGTIVFTLDGISWTRAITNTKTDLISIFFISERKGFAGGVDGTLLRSMDGGHSWKPIDDLPSQISKTDGSLVGFWRAIYFYNDSFGCVSSPIAAVCTQDGGASWYLPDFPKETKGTLLVGLANFGKELKFVTSCAGDFITRDGGKTWFRDLGTS